MDKTITEIETMREGLTDVLVYAINQYETKANMIVEDIVIRRTDGAVIVIDRLDVTSQKW